MYIPQSSLNKSSEHTLEWTTALVFGGGSEACNGVVFIVDRVLLPVDLDGKLNRRRGDYHLPLHARSHTRKHSRNHVLLFHRLLKFYSMNVVLVGSTRWWMFDSLHLRAPTTRQTEHAEKIKEAMKREEAEEKGGGER